MQYRFDHGFKGLLLSLFLVACANNGELREAEGHYADFMDAAGAIDTIDAGIAPEVAGLDRAVWAERYAASARDLRSALDAAPESPRSAEDRRALAAMRAGFAYREAAAEADDVTCSDARTSDLPMEQLSAALYACFESIGSAMEFEGRQYARISMLQMLEQVDEAQRRRALFHAMSPLWRAVNADGDATSPYRRLVAGRAAQMRTSIADAERSLGLEEGEGEAWLIAALEAWGGAHRGEPIEPWDFRHAYASGARAVERCAPVATVRRASEGFYRDLGAPIETLNVIQDVGSRPGMSPVDYADFTLVGRMADGEWRPATVRVSVVLESGGLGAAAELTHEFGHVAHFAAMRARPSLLLPDDLSMTVEAIADVTAWSVYEPVWQHHYLGCAGTEAEGLRARLGPVMLDIAWGLFELRMARDPALDPNAVWTEITRDYLKIAPHPDLSWWAVRGQLVDSPGYMINYALGAFVTADLRAHIAERIGSFDAGNARWYAETTRGLFRHGGAREPSQLLRNYLGRPVSPDALLRDIDRLHADR